MLQIPVLSAAFRTVRNSRVTRSGYNYQLYLPTAGGIGQTEQATGGFLPGVLDADLAEVNWCCYAWPANYEGSGNRTFFVNQSADIIATDDSAYTGPSGPASNSAFRGAGNTITGPSASGTTGRDGNFWRQTG